ncbi:MAG: DHH family phosphoesterase, partial [Deltaproteobacteria bacterium]|nr:DHH family phosphoesterase [Deltaproteobacteria bacterium]
MKSNLLKQAASFIKNEDRFLITTHINPDGDGIGSSLALGEILKKMGKEIVYYCDSPVQDQYLFLPGVDQFTRKLADVEPFNVVIVIDCGDFVTNNISGELRLVDASACAAAEIVYRLIKELEQPITHSVALNLYTAILTDTGSFRFSNTNRAAFEICEELVGLGIVPQFVAQQVYGTYPEGRLRLLTEVLNSLEISPNKIFAMV